jgi:hypothetical protein
MAWRTVLDVNFRLSQATERRLRLPTDKAVWRRFEEGAATLIHGLPAGATVLDLGGGRRCVCASAVQPPGRPKIVAEVRSWVTWEQPGYFGAIYPLFLLHAGYEIVTRHLRIRRLAACTVVRAVR